LSKNFRIRFEIRIPIYYEDKREIEPEKFEQTIKELYEMFGAFTIQSITEGGWRDPRLIKIHYEDFAGFFVDVDKKIVKDAIEFFKNYKEKLNERFQDTIHIVGYELYLV